MKCTITPEDLLPEDPNGVVLLAVTVHVSSRASQNNSVMRDISTPLISVFPSALTSAWELLPTRPSFTSATGQDAVVGLSLACQAGDGACA